MALERLEPCAGKLARTVLRRVEAGNGFHLSDSIGLQPPMPARPSPVKVPIDQPATPIKTTNIVN